jgi:hypothetical protein
VVVVADDALFDAACPNVVLVPLTEDARSAITEPSVIIELAPRPLARSAAGGGASDRNDVDSAGEGDGSDGGGRSRRGRSGRGKRGGWTDGLP